MVSKPADLNLLPEAFLLFEHHWPSFLEHYAQHGREPGDPLRWPAVHAVTWDDGQRQGVAIQVGEDLYVRQRAQRLYAGRPLPAGAHLGNVLTPADLLTRLAWQVAPLEQHAATSSGLPERILLRLQAPSEAAFVADVESLRREGLYAMNIGGLRDNLVSAALIQRSPDGAVCDGLFFITGLRTTSLRRWLTQQASPRIRLYRPYEPVLAPDQEAHPRGIWLPFSVERQVAQSLPYLATLAETLRHSSGCDVYLVERDAQGVTQVLAVEGSFNRIYYFSNFLLAGQAGSVTPLTPSQAPLKPFTLRLEVRDDPDRHPGRDRTLRALDEAGRRIKTRQTELNREARRVQQLRRMAETEELHATPFGQDPGTRRPRKSLYLFFETHAGDAGLRRGWPSLQEVLLTATLDQLRNLRYTFCRFALPLAAETAPLEITFHLVGGLTPEAQPDRNLPPGLEDADLLFEQDVDWRELGYNLYTPRGRYLLPPERPSPLSGQAPESYHRRLLYPRPVLDYKPEDAAESKRFEEECQLFNDLLAQSVYRPGQPPGQPPYLEDFKASEHLCLLYEDPVAGRVVPVYVRQEDWQPLASVAPQRLNQVGLTLIEPLPALLERVDHQLQETLAAREDRLEEQADALAADLEQQLVQALEQSLREREKELDAQRELRERHFREATLKQAQLLSDLRGEWDQTRAKLEQAQERLHGSQAERLLGRSGGLLGTARRLLEQLGERTAEVVKVAEEGADNWVTFVEQIIEINTRLQTEIDENFGETAKKLKAADANLAASHEEALRAITPRLSDLREKLDALTVRVEGRADGLARSLQHLTQAQSTLQSGTGSDDDAAVTQLTPSTPPSGEPGAAMRALEDELAAARQEVQLLKLEVQERDTELKRQSDEYERELKSLRRQAAQVAELERAQKYGEEESKDRETQLRKELKKLEEKWHQERTAAKELRTKQKKLEEELAGVQSTAEQATRSTANELESARAKIRQLEYDLQQYEDGAQSLALTKVRERFTMLAEIMDSLRYAEYNSANSTSPEARKIIQGLTQIRESLAAYLTTVHPDTELIPIKPGVTPFDPTAGHSAQGTVTRTDLPDETITAIIRDGFTHRGVVIREARVMVNANSQPAA